MTVLERMHGETMPEFPLDHARTYASVTEVVERGVCLLLVTADNRIAGTIGLEFGDLWFSGQKILGDRWTYIQPEYRKPAAFRRLVDAAKKVSDKRRIPLTLGVFSTKDATRKSVLYKRQKMVPVGETFMYRPKE